MVGALLVREQLVPHPAKSLVWPVRLDITVQRKGIKGPSGSDFSPSNFLRLEHQILRI